VPGEELYRIEFPERAGALGRFLDALADRWDISLFHYRSSGTTKGLVLLGVAMREGGPGREAFEAIVVRRRAAVCTATPHPPPARAGA